MGRRLVVGFVSVLCLSASVAIASTQLSPPVSGGAILGFGATYDAGGRNHTHRGVDLQGSAGEIVRAACDGVVEFAGEVPADGGGRTRAVTIRSADGLLVCVSPLSATRVSKGGRVVAGDALGELAESGDGSSSASHVHLSVRDGDTYVEPSIQSAGQMTDAPDETTLPSSTGGEVGGRSAVEGQGAAPNSGTAQVGSGATSAASASVVAGAVRAAPPVFDGARIRAAYAKCIGVMRSSARGRQFRFLGEASLTDSVQRPSLRISAIRGGSEYVSVLVALAITAVAMAARSRIACVCKRVVGRAE